MSDGRLSRQFWPKGQKRSEGACEKELKDLLAHVGAAPARQTVRPQKITCRRLNHCAVLNVSLFVAANKSSSIPVPPRRALEA